MKILKNLTIKNLKLNKKTSIVTTIGIMLSVALICAVSGMVTSLQATLVKSAIKDAGNRHVTVENVKEEDVKYFTNNRHVKSLFMTETLGYAKINSSNKYKPYVYVVGYTESAFSNMPVDVMRGRLPLAEDEVIVSQSLLDNTDLKLGDTIELDIGKRVCSDGSILSQNNPYTEDEECGERIVEEVAHSYKIVGVMKRPSFDIESYTAPGYTVITSLEQAQDNVNISLLFKNPKYYKDFGKMLRDDKKLSQYEVFYNTSLLRWSGVSLSDKSLTMLFMVSAIVIGIIIFTSVFVIKNSFDISSSLKRRMYGMLSSVGATSKQIKKSVLYEGFILGLFGIPLGICCGILADFILVKIINVFGSYLFEDISFVFSISIWPIILSIVLVTSFRYLKLHFIQMLINL